MAEESSKFVVDENDVTMDEERAAVFVFMTAVWAKPVCLDAMVPVCLSL